MHEYSGGEHYNSVVSLEEKLSRQRGRRKMVDEGTSIVKPAQAAMPLAVWPWIRGKSSNEERVPVWDTVKRRLLLGHSSPIGLNIDRYLASRPHMRLWTGNDPYEPKPPLLPGWRNRHEIYMARLDAGETPEEAHERVDSVAAVTEETALESIRSVPDASLPAERHTN
jgi:hypothetical protein